MLFRNRGGVAVRINRVAALFQRRILMGKEAFDFFPLDVHLSDKMGAYRSRIRVNRVCGNR